MRLPCFRAIMRLSPPVIFDSLMLLPLRYGTVTLMPLMIIMLMLDVVF